MNICTILSTLFTLCYTTVDLFYWWFWPFYNKISPQCWHSNVKNLRSPRVVRIYCASGVRVWVDQGQTDKRRQNRPVSDGIYIYFQIHPWSFSVRWIKLNFNVLEQFSAIRLSARCFIADISINCCRYREFLFTSGPNPNS